MDLKNTNSCVYMEISGISYGSPEERLRQFCDMALGKTRYHTLDAENNQLYSIYAFSAGFSPGQKNTNYGAKLAAFITENKLGKIVCTPPVENKAFHPGRHGAVWLWMPDVAALTAWYKRKK